MIPVSFLYDEYIDRRKLTEQKNPFEYIVPPPSRGVGTFMYKTFVLCEPFTKRVDSLHSFVLC